MKKQSVKIYYFTIFILCFLMPICTFGSEIKELETTGSVSFTGVYETPGTPEPAPEGAIKPDLPKQIAQPPSESRKNEDKRLPQTNEHQMSTLKLLGILIIVVTLGIWFWKHKKKKTNKESRI
ncbi:LPXTG cell wall anchor domain-containing protein [Enterococcus mundtii]|uniref:LPXTG cell wall anchor domain-containing protein n=1 Tax=Enterococcus mundtii TaxID=53346 RepID=UPI0032DF90B9